MAFIRDIHSEVDISIPITGDLNNPKYHLLDVLLDILTNIFVKPPTYPYRVVKQEKKQAKEDFVLLEWQPRQSTLEEDQEDQLRKISRYLFFHRNAELSIKSEIFEDKEKEMIMLFEAKKKYFMAINHLKGDTLSKDDSLTVTKLSIKDQSFITYLNKATHAAKNDFATELKCRKLIGEKKIDALYHQLSVTRKKQIQNFFTDKNVMDRVKFLSQVSDTPASGYSNVTFYYKGDQPK